MLHIWVPSCRVGLGTNRKALGYSYNICVTITPMDSPCQESHNCSLQCSQVGETEAFLFFSSRTPNTSKHHEHSHSDEVCSWVPTLRLRVQWCKYIMSSISNREGLKVRFYSSSGNRLSFLDLCDSIGKQHINKQPIPGSVVYFCWHRVSQHPKAGFLKHEKRFWLDTIDNFMYQLN